MKVAIVHDWLNSKFGGAENVLVELASMFPEAPIYTLLYNAEIVGNAIDPARIRPSRLQRWPGFLRRRQRYLLPFLPTTVEQFDLSEFDLVISSSSAYAKGVITRPETLHVCYCYSPMRYVWDYWPRYIEEQNPGPLRRAAIHLLTSRQRVWDFYSASRVDRWLAISNTTAQRIKKFYHQEVDRVIYPGAEIGAFKPADQKGDYFVTLASLTPYKKIDLAVAACNEIGAKLIVIGDGADRRRLEELAGPTIEFAGRVSDEKRAQLLAEAKGLIFPNEEDFGIAPVEAMASGTPVIGLAKGGVTETVVDGKTGLLFTDPSVKGLVDALKKFETMNFKTEELTRQAHKFSNEAFRHNFREYIEKAYDDFKK